MGAVVIEQCWKHASIMNTCMFIMELDTKWEICDCDVWEQFNGTGRK